MNIDTISLDMGNTARKVAFYLTQRYTGLSNREIGERFGGIEGSAVSKVSTRMKEEMASNKQLSKLVSELDSSFKIHSLAGGGRIHSEQAATFDRIGTNDRNQRNKH